MLHLRLLSTFLGGRRAEAGSSFVKFKKMKEKLVDMPKNLKINQPALLPLLAILLLKILNLAWMHCLQRFPRVKPPLTKLFLKADVRGSLEALEGFLNLLKATKHLEVLQAEVGQVTKNDVKMQVLLGQRPRF